MAGTNLNLQLTLNTNGSITARWDKINNATKYRAYMGEENASTLIYNTTLSSTYCTSKSNLAENKKYKVTVIAYKSNGTSITSAAKTILIPLGFYNTNLAVPGNVRASAETNAVTISWNSVSGATSYDVLFDNVVTNVTGTSKRYTGLTANSRHSYAVRAKSQNATGSYSTTQYVTTLQAPAQYPTTPTGIKKSADETTATISWNSVSNATGYELLFNGTTYSLTTTSKTVTGLLAGRTYSFQVRAKNANGYSAYSSSMIVTMAPNAPTGITATPTSGGATIRWNSVSGAAGYTLDFDDCTYEVGSSQTSYTVTGKLGGTDYRYRVRSKSVDGPGTYSSYYWVKTLDAQLVPPSAIGHTTSENSIEIYWNKISGAAEYEILFDGRTYRATNASRSIFGLSPNITYKYKIRAIGSNGKASDYSREVTATTAPVSPRPLAEIDGETLTVSWQPVTGATGYRVMINNNDFTTNTNSYVYRNVAPNTTYNIKVKSMNKDGEGNYSSSISVQSGAATIDSSGIVEEIGSYQVKISWPPVAGADYYEINVDGDTHFTYNTYWQSQEFVEKTTYRYKIRAYTGNTPGPYTEERSFTTKPYAPEIPTNVRATSTADSVTVMWTADSRATSFEVLFDGQTYETVSTSKTITGLEPDTLYYYKVRAGNDGGYSNYSWQKSIQTKMPVPATPSDVSATSTTDSITISFTPVYGAENYDIMFDKDLFHLTKEGKLLSRTANVQMKSAKRAVAMAVSAEPDAPAGIRFKLKGLKPDTTHSFQARATNVTGASEFSPKQYITTKIYKTTGIPERRKSRSYPDGRYSYTGHDPINVITGSFTWSYTWLEDKGKDKLGFTTMYDSDAEIDDFGMGKKWTHSFAYRLSMDDKYAYFTTPNGNVIPFFKNVVDGTFAVQGTSIPYTLVHNVDGTYSVKCENDAEYIFDSNLHLKQINENGVKAYSFTVDANGNITRIDGVHGAFLTLRYSDGRLSSVLNAAGAYCGIDYSANGTLTSIYNSNIKPICFSYDEDSNLITILGFDGKIFLTNTYDELGRVTKQVLAGRGTSRVIYDDENHKNTFIDELGNSTIYTYDVLGYVTDIEQGDSKQHDRFNSDGQLVERIDSLGNSTMIGYDDKGRMNRVIYPDRTDEKITYADNNEPAKVVARDGSEVNYRYDERNNLIEATDERGNVSSYTYDDFDNLITYTDRLGNAWNFEYDEANHLKKAIDPKGNASLYTHDAIGQMTSFTSPLGNNVEHTYSRNGELLEVKDADGSITYEYDVNGNPVKITDRRGNAEQISYNDMGQIASVSDRAGGATTYEYDSHGNLIATKDANGYETVQNYDDRGNVAFIKDKNGETTSFTYDANNRLIKVEDALGGTVDYTYDCMGQVTAVTDQLLRERFFTYDDDGNVIKETDPLGKEVRYSFDEAGNLLTKTDEEGAVTTYTYDAENRVKTIETSDGATEFIYDALGRIISIKDTEGHTEATEYDADGNPVLSKDKEENETTFEYDHAGRIVKETLATGAETTFEYDENGNCVKRTDALGNVTLYEYDGEDRLKKTTDPAGHTTEVYYDGMGQAIQIKDANDNVWKYAYDGNGNLRCEISPTDDTKVYKYDALNRLESVTDEDENTAEYTYDAVGNCTSFKDFNGNTLTYEWDANNRLVKVTNDNDDSTVLTYTGTGLVSSVTDAEGVETKYEYDSRGRLTRLSDALGHNTTFTYDKLGRVLTETDANGNTTEYEYSPTGNLTKVITPEGDFMKYTYDAAGNIISEENALGDSVTYERDALGQITKFTDALGNETEFTYTVTGNIASVKNAEGRVTGYAYDANGNLTEITDPYGNVTHYEYDSLNNRIKECIIEEEEPKCVTIYQYDKKNRKIKEINPLLDEQNFEYDANGNLVTFFDEEGRWTEVTYDLNNRPVEMLYPDRRRATLRYNKRGELVELKDWTGTTSYERDSLGRLTKVVDPEGRETGYSYDGVGNRTGISYPDGSTVSYAFDKNNRIKRITDGEEVLAEYLYDAAGRLTELSKGDGISRKTIFNANGLPTRLTYEAGETSLAEEAFTYDSLGRIISVRRTGSPEGISRSAEYGYDALGRITSYLINGETLENYLYDIRGNRLATVLNGNERTAYQYDDANRLTSITEAGVTFGFEYDKCGNLIKERRGDALVKQYVYDTDLRLTKGLNFETGEETEYAYNALRELVKTSQKLRAGDEYRTKERKYVPDFLTPALGNNLMTYETGKGSTKTVFGGAYDRTGQKYTPDIPNPEASLSEKTFFHADLYGSPLLATDEAGSIKHVSRLGIWGEGETTLPDTLDENLRFSTYRFDPVIGKYYGNARFYDPKAGRMLAIDPIKRGINGYGYCDDDPVDYVDPEGELLATVAGIVGGFAWGFIESSISQVANGEKFNVRKALGRGANDAIVFGTRVALTEYPIGLPLGFAANTAAGALGYSVEKLIAGEDVNPYEAGLTGITNGVSSAIYGQNPIKSGWESLAKGFGVGFTNELIRYPADFALRNASRGAAVGTALGAGAGYYIKEMPTAKDPRQNCESGSPFNAGLNGRVRKGYDWRSQTSLLGLSIQEEFSAKKYLAESAISGADTAIGSLVSYNVDKGLNKVSDFAKRLFNKPKTTNTPRLYSDQELVDAAFEINEAQYGNSRYKYKNPVSVIQAENGAVAVAKNNYVIGPKSRDKATEIFGDDVIIVRGRGVNYNNAINAVKTYAPKHAEARGIQAMISRNIPIEGARQATTLRSCVDCTGLQGAYGIINLTGKK